MTNRDAKMGLTGMLREMFRDNPEETVSTEQVDEKLREEEIENKGNEQVLLEEEEDRVTDYIEIDSARARKELEDAKQLERMLGILVAVLCLLLTAGALFTGHKIRYLIGVLIGGMLAESLLLWITRSVKGALDKANAANRYMRVQAVSRYAFVFAVLAGTAMAETHWYPDSGHAMLYGAVLGLLTVKLAAFLYPLVTRFQNR